MARTTKIERNFSHWEGTLYTIVDALETAVREVAEESKAPPEDRLVYCAFDYEGGGERMETLEEIRAHLPTVELEKIRLVSAGAQNFMGAPQVGIWASADAGVGIEVRGEEAWARRVADMLAERFEPGARPAHVERTKRVSTSDLVQATALSWSLVPLMIVWAALGFWEGAVGTLVLAATWAVFQLRRLERKTEQTPVPHLTLLR